MAAFAVGDDGTYGPFSTYPYLPYRSGPCTSSSNNSPCKPYCQNGGYVCCGQPGCCKSGNRPGRGYCRVSADSGIYIRRDGSYVRRQRATGTTAGNMNRDSFDNYCGQGPYKAEVKQENDNDECVCSKRENCYLVYLGRRDCRN